jgi:hypothetical protein
MCIPVPTAAEAWVGKGVHLKRTSMHGRGRSGQRLRYRSHLTVGCGGVRQCLAAVVAPSWGWLLLRFLLRSGRPCAVFSMFTQGGIASQPLFCGGAGCAARGGAGAPPPHQDLAHASRAGEVAAGNGPRRCSSGSSQAGAVAVHLTVGLMTCMQRWTLVCYHADCELWPTSLA